MEECIIITNENKEVCTVRSLDLANYLCNHGHKMKKVIDSDKNPRFKVFLFEDSKAIQNCIAKPTDVNGNKPKSNRGRKPKAKIENNIEVVK